MCIHTTGKTAEEILIEVAQKHPELTATQKLVMAAGLIGTKVETLGRIYGPKLPKLYDVLYDEKEKK